MATTRKKAAEAEPQEQPEPKRGRGRPPHRPTAATREKVSVCCLAKMPHEQIAMALRIDADTLKKHYTYELAHGAAEKKAEIMGALMKAAKRGNVSASKALMQFDPELAPPAAEPEKVKAAAAAQAAAQEADAARAAGKAPEGKKEQQRAEALTAADGTGWGPLLNPPTSTVQ